MRSSRRTTAALSHRSSGVRERARRTWEGDGARGAGIPHLRLADTAAEMLR